MLMHFHPPVQHCCSCWAAPSCGLLCMNHVVQPVQSDLPIFKKMSVGAASWLVHMTCFRCCVPVLVSAQRAPQQVRAAAACAITAFNLASREQLHSASQHSCSVLHANLVTIVVGNMEALLFCCPPPPPALQLHIPALPLHPPNHRLLLLL